MKELEQERNREREREWNKPRPRNARTGSSPSLHFPEHHSRTSSAESPRPGSALSNISVDSPRARFRTSLGLSERPRATSGGGRPDSALSNDSTSIIDFPQTLRRYHSLTNRSQSPAHIEHQIEEVERERNWNAPRPKWHGRSLPSTPDRPTSLSSSKLSTTPQSPVDRRRQSTTPLITQDVLNITRPDSPLARRHSKQKIIVSQIERRNVISSAIPKSPRPRLSNNTADSPSHSRSPLRDQAPHHKSRIPIPSNRAHGPRDEIPKSISSIHAQDESEEIQEQSLSSLPQGVNGQSQLQESMELTEAYNGSEMSSAIPSFSDSTEPFPALNNDTAHTTSSLKLDDSRDIMHQAGSEDEGNAGSRVFFESKLILVSRELYGTGADTYNSND